MGEMYSRSYPHLYRGVVELNIDPENLGRCKVRVPSIHGSYNSALVEALPWARPLVFSPVRKSRGSVNIPDVGDIVWVLFEESIRECPIYFGGAYGQGDVDINLDSVDFYVEEDTKISYNRVSRVCSIQVGNNTVEISPGGIHLLGNTNLDGDLTVSGTLTVNNLIINGSCNRECDCP